MRTHIEYFYQDVSRDKPKLCYFFSSKQNLSAVTRLCWSSSKGKTIKVSKFFTVLLGLLTHSN